MTRLKQEVFSKRFVQFYELNCLRSQNSRFVKRPNRPQVGPIEKYWALCKKNTKSVLKNPNSA